MENGMAPGYGNSMENGWTCMTARAPALHIPLLQMDSRAPANKTATNTLSEQGGGDSNIERDGD
jgi:hypothetical protein